MVDRRDEEGPAASGKLEARREPTQARSRATVARIRDAAASIIETEGMARLNSNRIAEVAGVSLGSIYKFFPNKESIISSIIQKWREENDRILSELIEIRPSETLIERIYGWFSYIVETDASRMWAMSQAVQYDPDLGALNESSKEPSIVLVSEMLRRDGCRLEGDELRGAALRIIDLGAVLLVRMHARRHEPRDDQMRWTMMLMRAAVDDAMR